LGSLDVVNGIKHNHAFGNFRGVITEFTTGRIAAENFENCSFQSVKRLNS
jgi:hypothetical protein